jgi:hypothetical protein
MVVNRQNLGMLDTEASLQELVADDKISWEEYEARVGWLVRYRPSALLEPPTPPQRPKPDKLTKRTVDPVAMGMAQVACGIGIVGAAVETLVMHSEQPLILMCCTMLMSMPAFVRALQDEGPGR